MDIPGFEPLTVVPISCDSSGGPPEWAMIELQGELERRDAAQPGKDFTFGQIKRSSTVSSTAYDTCGCVLRRRGEPACAAIPIQHSDQYLCVLRCARDLLVLLYYLFIFINPAQ